MARDDYPTQDMAVRTLTMTRTKQILTDFFSPQWSASTPITPTLLFAQESIYRGVGLDDLRAGARYMSVDRQRHRRQFRQRYAALATRRARPKMTPFCAMNSTGAGHVERPARRNRSGMR